MKKRVAFKTILCIGGVTESGQIDHGKIGQPSFLIGSRLKVLDLRSSGTGLREFEYRVYHCR